MIRRAWNSEMDGNIGEENRKTGVPTSDAGEHGSYWQQDHIRHS